MVRGYSLVPYPPAKIIPFIYFLSLLFVNIFVQDLHTNFTMLKGTDMIEESENFPPENSDKDLSSLHCEHFCFIVF